MKTFFSFQGSTGVLFEDIAGIDDVVEELQEASTKFLESLTYCKDQATKSCFFHNRRMKLIMLKLYHKEVNTDIHIAFW